MSNKVKGGLSDKLTLNDLARKWSKNSKDGYEKMLEHLKTQLNIGIKVELEHTKDKNVAKEIAMDHLSEDPNYYTKLKKIEPKEEGDKSARKQFVKDLQDDPDYKEFKKRAIYNYKNSDHTFGTPRATDNDNYIDKKRYSRVGKETDTTESTDASSSGAFSSPSVGGVIKKNVKFTPKNFKKYNVNEEQDVTEVTDASSSGAYDAPFGDGGKNPLKINGEKSIKTSRAVKDKKFPKWGGPDSVFIKIKDKCKKYPYCNQGDVNVIELLEIQDEIKEISGKYGIPYSEMEKVVINEFNKIFINMNISDLNNLIESVASEEVKKTILSENTGKHKVYHIKLNGEPVETFNTEEEAQEALPKYQDKDNGELLIEPDEYESYEDMIEKMDQMGQELEEKENQNMENQEPMEGNAFTSELLKAKEEGKDKFTVDGKEYDVEECWKQLEEQEGECSECDSSMEESINESKVCDKCGKELNEQGMCNECSTMKESVKKKKVLKLTESQMIDMIKKIVKESVPGIDVTKKAQKQSKEDNEANAKEVAEKIKKATTIEGGDNPEFPKQNNDGTKVARQNNEEENEFVEDNRGGTAMDLDFDHEPSDKFKERMKASLEGDSKMGNSQDAANVVKSDLGKNLAKQAERKKKKDEEAPMYNKDVQPVKEVNESEVKSTQLLNEEIEKMKKIASYNKKTQ